MTNQQTSLMVSEFDAKVKTPSSNCFSKQMRVCVAFTAILFVAMCSHSVEVPVKVTCPKCDTIFTAADNKATLAQSMGVGAAIGALGGGAGGAYIGTGVGIATGGVGIPAAPIFAGVGALGGGIIGGLGGALYAKSNVKCPKENCGHVFNPLAKPKEK
ncbi:MAG: hypothetical protein FWG50_06020 [Kiritimatiellaeota bacterium]|nr:hypothetical protein [Kiritimatiellota bacterium]